ncbi:uncharacterized protein TNCV_2224401 [Trichonephila clavipes]|nr:uncharacterized protein TNCV_2224401 [Trichonephila clavipes]
MPRQKQSSLVSKQKANKRWCSEHYSLETDVFKKDKTSISSALSEKKNMRCQNLEDSCLNDLNCNENSEAPHYLIMDVQFFKGLLKNMLCDVCKSYSLKIYIGENPGFFGKISVFCTFYDMIKSRNFTSRRMSDSEGNESQSFDINMRMVQSFSRIRKDVTVDATWLTRGHSSQIGVGCVIDLLIGFVMDFEIVSKRCIECEHAKSGLGQHSAEFHMWYEGHISSCVIYYIISSCAIEQEAALKLWQISEDNGLRYTTLLSDGNAKTFQYLNTKEVYAPEIK